MLRMPMSRLGGASSAVIISLMKLEVMPMMAIMEAACMNLVALKVAPRAP